MSVSKAEIEVVHAKLIELGVCTAEAVDREAVQAALDAAERARWQPIETLRNNGWAVAIHNDYWLNGARRTFWLLTHRNGRWVKGEGDTDYDALAECIKQANDLPGKLEWALGVK